MATKLKSNKFLVIIISCLVLVGLSVGMYMSYPTIENYVNENKSNYFEDEYFYKQLKRNMYTHYFNQLRTENELTIDKVYEIPTKNIDAIYHSLLSYYSYGDLDDSFRDDEDYDFEEAEENSLVTSINGFFSQTEATITAPVEDSSMESFYELAPEKKIDRIKTVLNEIMEQDLDELRSRNYFDNLYCFITKSNGDEVLNYGWDLHKKLANLSLLLNNPTKEELEQLQQDYQYYIVIEYDSEGNVKVSNTYGATFVDMRNQLVDSNAVIKSMLEDVNIQNSSYDVSLMPIKEMTYVFGVPKQMLYRDQLWSDMYYNAYSSCVEMSLIYSTVGLIIVFIAALVMPFKTISNIRVIRSILKWPIETLVLTATIPIVFFVELLPSMIYSTIENRLMTGIPVQAQMIFTAGFNLFVWFAVFTWMFILFLYIKNIFKQGWKRTFVEKCWTIRGCRFLSRKLRSFLKVDLKQKNTKKLFFLIGAQFILLSLFCLGWFFGIIGVFIYSLVLYVILRKYLIKTQKDYAQLFEVTEQLADGNLDVVIKEDLGIFNAFKDEVMHIQDGFKKAVHAEVRSQRMKTDLIANVSHDLKTPLTSIITYTDLLKDETLDTEKRAQYLETLDQKAQRLKALIEDLFEMSKASSGNMTMNLQEIEVTSLIKQTLLELEDKIEAANLTIRRQFPEHKVMLMLDSERTFRIFDNLILNITKYAMPGTRAYIDVLENDTDVQIIFRNMSADEITVNVDELTERFVRGDQARHTEGSGLGLAIAKSFVELQGGTFDIQIDGDLFKVVITFNK